jgi:hypothetical protein
MHGGSGSIPADRRCIKFRISSASIYRNKEPMPMIKILYINNDGAGFCDYVDIEQGTAVSQFFAARIEHGKPGDYLIRVNRQPVARDQVLQDGDRVSVTPTKIEGVRPVCSKLAA